MTLQPGTGSGPGTCTAVHGTGVPRDHFVVAGCYAALYVMTALVLAAQIFRRRDFR